MTTKQKFVIWFVTSTILGLVFMYTSITYASDPFGQIARWNRATERSNAIKQTLRLLDEHTEKNTPKAKVLSLEQRVKILEQKLKLLEKMPQIQRHYRIMENQERRRERFNNKRR